MGSFLGTQIENGAIVKGFWWLKLPWSSCEERERRGYNGRIGVLTSQMENSCVLWDPKTYKITIKEGLVRVVRREVF